MFLCLNKFNIHNKGIFELLYLLFQVYRRDISQPWLQRYYARDWELTGDPYKAQVIYIYFILIQNVMTNDPKRYLMVI